MELAALAGIASTLALGAASPGPSFVMVARVAITTSRTAGIRTALGMGVGGLVFAVASLLGLHGLLLAVPGLYLGLKVAGGMYLAWLGVRIWRASGNSLVAGMAERATRQGAAASDFLLGLTTQLSNPKTAIVYASVFATFLPQDASPGFSLVVAALVFAIEAGWYALVALLLSSSGPRNRYLSYRKWIDRVAGGAMLGLGIRMAASANRP